MKIVLKNITKAFGVKTVIQPTDLTIHSGSLTTLLGPSGCGKTTLLRMIAGLETPDSGEILFGERCVFSAQKKLNIPPEQRGLGFVFQDFALWPHMNVYENVAFGLRAANHTDGLDKKVRDALHAVRLDDFADRFPHQLSGGQQQRVAIGRALITRPALILADEPTGNLDTKNTSEVIALLKEASRKYEQTIILITHSRAIAQTADRILSVSDGVLSDLGRCRA